MREETKEEVRNNCRTEEDLCYYFFYTPKSEIMRDAEVPLTAKVAEWLVDPTILLATQVYSPA